MVNHEIRRRKEKVIGGHLWKSWETQTPTQRREEGKARQVTQGHWGPSEAGGDGFRAEDQVPRRRPHFAFLGSSWTFRPETWGEGRQSCGGAAQGGAWPRGTPTDTFLTSALESRRLNLAHAPADPAHVPRPVSVIYIPDPAPQTCAPLLRLPARCAGPVGF